MMASRSTRRLSEIELAVKMKVRTRGKYFERPREPLL